MGSQHTPMYTMYTGFTKFIIHNLYSRVFEAMMYPLPYVKKKTKYIHIKH